MIVGHPITKSDLLYKLRYWAYHPKLLYTLNDPIYSKPKSLAWKQLKKNWDTAVAILKTLESGDIPTDDQLVALYGYTMVIIEDEDDEDNCD